ncbi:MAG: (2Fe-2S) ferredoxin domain-containing protein [Cyanobacteria bacterium P01_D01_bin.105]
MKILQGKYLRSIESAKGTLKGIELKTAAGKHVIEIPKALRAIAQAELALGDDVRVWTTRSDELKPKKARQEKSNQKKNVPSKKQKSSAKASNLTAIQVIPIAPKAKVTVPKAIKPKSTKAKVKTKKQAATPLTVQLCQKKNCCRKGGDKLWVAFEAARAAASNAERQAFKLEAVGCLGGCKNGPNIRLLPKNVKYRNVKPSDIGTLIGNR